MRNLDNKLKNRKINYKELLKYGFKKENEKYLYKTKIQNNQFEVNIIISDKENHAMLIDLENETEYILTDIETSSGKFVGQLRQEYDQIIEEIIAKCTSKEVFKSKQAKEIIIYIEEKYNDKLEFLW